MRAFVTGQVGVDKGPYLEAVREQARKACTFEKVAHGTAFFRTKYGQPAMFNCVHARIGF